jgi:hypothetical protein
VTTGPSSDADLTARLAEVLTDDVLVPVERGPVIDALLPVVREYGDQRAAEALRAAAAELDDLYESGGAFGADNLRASVRLEKRAAALRGQAGRET